MKKTKLLTSVAALALVLGLGACNASNCEEVTGDEDGSLAAAETGDNLYWHYDEAGEIAIW